MCPGSAERARPRRCQDTGPSPSTPGTACARPGLQVPQANPPPAQAPERTRPVTAQSAGSRHRGQVGSQAGHKYSPSRASPLLRPGARLCPQPDLSPAALPTETEPQTTLTLQFLSGSGYQLAGSWWPPGAWAGCAGSSVCGAESSPHGGTSPRQPLPSQGPSAAHAGTGSKPPLLCPHHACGSPLPAHPTAFSRKA